MNRKYKIIAGLAIFGILVGSIFFFKVLKSTPPQAKSANEFNSEQLVKNDSTKKSYPFAKVTLVEFIDYEGEFSRTNYPVVKKILNEYKGKVNYVVRYFPTHFNSILAAKAAKAAGEQGKYWEMHDKLFETQAEWSEVEEPQTSMFISYAENLGLNIKKFSASLESDKYKEEIERDLKEVRNYGVKDPSVYFIGSVQESNVVTYAHWKEEIEKLL